MHDAPVFAYVETDGKPKNLAIAGKEAVMAHILIVEDDDAINELVKRNLYLTGHTCEQAFDGHEAQRLYEKTSYDLILLDVMLPGISGFELVSQFTETPVIFITAKDNSSDKLRGLTSGAEDYITKPFDILELLARIHIVLRRNHKTEDIFCLDGVEMDFKGHTVCRNGKPVKMTPQEYSLLEILIRNRNLALSREQLLEQAWGYDYEGDTRTVDVHIQKLRRKLGWEERIRTVYKMGYRLEVPK